MSQGPPSSIRNSFADGSTRTIGTEVSLESLDFFVLGNQGFMDRGAVAGPLAFEIEVIGIDSLYSFCN